MKKILVPTDFSKNTHSAIDFAIDIVNRLEGEIILLNTYKLARRAGMFIGVEKMMREESKTEMAKLVRKVKPRLKPGVILKSKVVKGDSINTVVLAANKMEIDLIIMGTQGASGLKEVFIGSTANGVINRTKIPVLAVPSSFKHKPIEVIVLSMSSNFNELGEKINTLKILANLYNSKIKGLHIKTGSGKTEVKGKAKDILEGTDHTYHEMAGSTAKINSIIQQYVKDNNADMLCMIKQKRGFWENLFHNSVTTIEVFHSEVPILVLQE
jgi:nucleotide-binding universal stress UspA family protein